MLQGDFAAREQQQRADLQRWKAIATSILGGMATIFVGASVGQQYYPWLAYVRAFGEAGMIGALADWFAVVALFRHPLGIPIPHTAIIPANKDRIGTSLGRFVATNFLTTETLSPKLQALDPAGKVAEWLSDPVNAKIIADRASLFIPDIVNSLDDDAVNAVVKKNIIERVEAIPAAPLAGNILSGLLTDNRYQTLLDSALGFAATFLDENKDIIRQKIKTESPWYIPDFVDNKLYETIITKMEHTLQEVRHDPNHEMRRRFHRAMQEFVTNLRNSPEYATKGETIKQDIIDHPIIQQYLDRLWTDIKVRLLADVANPDSAIRENLEKGVLRIGNALLHDAGLREKLNERIQTAAVDFIVGRSDEIASLIAETVERWDTDTVATRIELQVGKDLQYVRINGAIVGGLVGVIIHAVSQIFF
jgi:uncharacterized membrane-anchored protein YjiN (DUF445 family)